MKSVLLAALLATTISAVAAERTTLPILDDISVKALCTQSISEMQARYKKVEAEGDPNLLATWDDVTIDVENGIGPIAVLNNLHPDKKVRDAAQDCLVKISSVSTELFQNEKLYQHVLAAKPGNAAQTQFRQDLLESFEDSGVSLPKEKRARAKEISDRITVLGQEFAKNIRDNTTKLTFTPAEYKGLPQAYVDRVKNAEGNIVVGFDYPDYVPFMSASENEKARERYYIAYMKRGSARNLEILDEVTKLRKELATLYGYPSYAHYATKRNMSETPAAVMTFLDDVAKSVRDVEKRELEELRKMKSDTLGTPLASTKLNRWDVPYWRERLREKRYAVDQESTRKYFPSDAARNWIIDITQRVYGVTFEQAQVPVWHPDVLYYDVKDTATGKYVGGIYLDLYPRDGKFKHAAASSARRSSTRHDRRPVSVLMTNFDRKAMTYDEVNTFFHEFGHVMHNVLSETEFASQGGTSVQRDFVEAPSQIYEEWSSMEAWKKVEGASILGYTPGTEFPGTFGHLLGGYAAGYYGYMWSEVIGKDMLSAWGPNILDANIGARFRKRVLGRGGEQSAKVVVEEFLGRPVSSKAFFEELRGGK